MLVCCCCCCGGCRRGGGGGCGGGGFGGGGGSGGEGCVVETCACCGSCMYIRNNPPRTVAQVQKGRSVATSDACVSVGCGLEKLGGMAQGLCLVE